LFSIVLFIFKAHDVVIRMDEAEYKQKRLSPPLTKSIDQRIVLLQAPHLQWQSCTSYPCQLVT